MTLSPHTSALWKANRKAPSSTQLAAALTGTIPGITWNMGMGVLRGWNCTKQKSLQCKTALVLAKETCARFQLHYLEYFSCPSDINLKNRGVGAGMEGWDPWEHPKYPGGAAPIPVPVHSVRDQLSPHPFPDFISKSSLKMAEERRGAAAPSGVTSCPSHALQLMLQAPASFQQLLA